MIQIPQTSYEKFTEIMSIKTEPGEIEEGLWKKVNKYTPHLKSIPGILMIGVGNSLSMNACHKDSDIDLFIVTRKNRLWIVRVLTTLYFSVLGLRKNRKHHAGRFCLSFFVTEDALDLRNIAIENDIYLYFWILYMKPIVDIDNTYEKFITANKKWCNFGEYTDIEDQSKSRIRIQKTRTHSPLLLSGIGDVVESSLKYVFLPRTKKTFQKLGKPFGVIISDNMLKFHDKDRRREIGEEVR